MGHERPSQNDPESDSFSDNPRILRAILPIDVTKYTD